MSLNVDSFGVLQRNKAGDAVDTAIELIKLNGYAVIDSGLAEAEIASISVKFNEANSRYLNEYNAKYKFSEINEDNLIRLITKYDKAFLDLASNKFVLRICRALMGDYIVLNQQNGVINPSNKAYSQGSYHRDLPYQHFTSSKPLAVNALYCVDDFTFENGATYVIPGSHKGENFPSDPVIAASKKQIEASAGSFILLDCMTYHSGAPNKSLHQRRAINHVYTIPLFRQQIDLPRTLADTYVMTNGQRKLLGYDVSTPFTLEEYFYNCASRRTSQ